MRKLCIAIGISLLFLIGTVGLASAQKIHCWDLNRDTLCDIGGIENEDMNGDGKCNSRDCQGDPGIQAGEIRGIIDFCEPSGGGILVYIPGESFMAKTGISGEFILHYVPAGTYNLIVEIPVFSPVTISDVLVEDNEISDLGTIPICHEYPQRTFSEAYYTASDTDGQAALAIEDGILIDEKVDTGYRNLGMNGSRLADSIGGDLGSAQSVSKVRMYGDNEEWSNFKILYNTENNAYGWTEVTNLTVTKDREPDGLGGKNTNELSFDTVSARWWKVWASPADSTGVISVYEFEAYAE